MFGEAEVLITNLTQVADRRTNSEGVSKWRIQVGGKKGMENFLSWSSEHKSMHLVLDE